MPDQATKPMLDPSSATSNAPDDIILQKRTALYKQLSESGIKLPSQEVFVAGLNDEKTRDALYDKLQRSNVKLPTRDVWHSGLSAPKAPAGPSFGEHIVSQVLKDVNRIGDEYQAAASRLPKEEPLGIDLSRTLPKVGVDKHGYPSSPGVAGPPAFTFDSTVPSVKPDFIQPTTTEGVRQEREKLIPQAPADIVEEWKRTPPIMMPHTYAATEERTLLPGVTKPANLPEAPTPKEQRKELKESPEARYAKMQAGTSQQQEFLKEHPQPGLDTRTTAAESDPLWKNNEKILGGMFSWTGLPAAVGGVKEIYEGVKDLSSITGEDLQDMFVFHGAGLRLQAGWKPYTGLTKVLHGAFEAAMPALGIANGFYPTMVAFNVGFDVLAKTNPDLAKTLGQPFGTAAENGSETVKQLAATADLIYNLAMFTIADRTFKATGKWAVSKFNAAEAKSLAAKIMRGEEIAPEEQRGINESATKVAAAAQEKAGYTVKDTRAATADVPKGPHPDLSKAGDQVAYDEHLQRGPRYDSTGKRLDQEWLDDLEKKTGKDGLEKMLNEYNLSDEAVEQVKAQLKAEAPKIRDLRSLAKPATIAAAGVAGAASLYEKKDVGEASAAAIGVLALGKMFGGGRSEGKAPPKTLREDPARFIDWDKEQPDRDYKFAARKLGLIFDGVQHISEKAGGGILVFFKDQGTRSWELPDKTIHSEWIKKRAGTASTIRIKPGQTLGDAFVEHYNHYYNLQAKDIQAIHRSPKDLRTIDPKRLGTGLRGAWMSRFRGRPKGSFWTPEGAPVEYRLEGMKEYPTLLKGIYPASDPQHMMEQVGGDANKYERAVRNLGYHGVEYADEGAGYNEVYYFDKVEVAKIHNSEMYSTVPVEYEDGKTVHDITEKFDRLNLPADRKVDYLARFNNAIGSLIRQHLEDAFGKRIRVNSIRPSRGAWINSRTGEAELNPNFILHISGNPVERNAAMQSAREMCDQMQGLAVRPASPAHPNPVEGEEIRPTFFVKKPSGEWTSAQLGDLVKVMSDVSGGKLAAHTLDGKTVFMVHEPRIFDTGLTSDQFAATTSKISTALRRHPVFRDYTTFTENMYVAVDSHELRPSEERAANAQVQPTGGGAGTQAQPQGAPGRTAENLRRGFNRDLTKSANTLLKEARAESARKGPRGPVEAKDQELDLEPPESAQTKKAFVSYVDRLLNQGKIAKAQNVAADYMRRTDGKPYEADAEESAALKRIDDAAEKNPISVFPKVALTPEEMKARDEAYKQTVADIEKGKTTPREAFPFLYDLLDRYKKNMPMGGEWYDRCKQELLDRIGPKNFNYFVKALAATSSGMAIDANVTLALHALYNKLAAGAGAAETGKFSFVRTHRGALGSLDSGMELGGRKVPDFSRALAGDVNATPIDRWMMRLFGYSLPEEGTRGGRTSLADPIYDAVSSVIHSIAKDTGLNPRDVQARLWVQIRRMYYQQGLMKNMPKEGSPWELALERLAGPKKQLNLFDEDPNWLKRNMGDIIIGLTGAGMSAATATALSSDDEKIKSAAGGFAQLSALALMGMAMPEGFLQRLHERLPSEGARQVLSEHLGMAAKEGITNEDFIYNKMRTALDEDPKIPMSEKRLLLSEAPEQIAEAVRRSKVEAGIKQTEGVTSEMPKEQGIATKKVMEGTGHVQQFLSYATNRDEIKYRMDAVDTESNLAGRQARRHVELNIKDPLDRLAMTFLVQAKGDKSVLISRLAKMGENGNQTYTRTPYARFMGQVKPADARLPKNLTYGDIVRHAIDNFDRLNALRPVVSDMFHEQAVLEKLKGLSTEEREGYAPGVYSHTTMLGEDGVEFANTAWQHVGEWVSSKLYGTVGGGGSKPFLKPKIYADYAEAIAAGERPQSLDIGELAEYRIKRGQRAVLQRTFVEELASMQDSKGNPVVLPRMTNVRNVKTGEWEKIKRDDLVGDRTHGYFYQGNPVEVGDDVGRSGYRRVVLPNGTSELVHPHYAPLFKAIMGESAFETSPPLKMLGGTAGFVKHGTLLFDTFHLVRMGLRELFTAPGKVFTGQLGYRKGLSLLEYSDKDLDLAVKENTLTPEMADQIRKQRPDVMDLVRSGFNVGRVNEAMWSHLTQQMPVIGTFNRFVFDKFTRGAMVECGLLNLERNIKRFPEYNREQVLRITARETNEYFGNLMRQSIFKSRTAQDITRLIFLAPQWVESMARFEMRAIGGGPGAKGTGFVGGLPAMLYDGMIKHELRMGSLTRAMATGIAG
jgi:hypothetical protein